MGYKVYTTVKYVLKDSFGRVLVRLSPKSIYIEKSMSIYTDPATTTTSEIKMNILKDLKERLKDISLKNENILTVKKVTSSFNDNVYIATIKTVFSITERSSFNSLYSDFIDFIPVSLLDKIRKETCSKPGVFLVRDEEMLQILNKEIKN